MNKMAQDLSSNQRSLDKLKSLITKADCNATNTSFDQRAVEVKCYSQFKSKHEKDPGFTNVSLERRKTIKYLKNGLTELSSDYSCLDASRPWLLYWILHALELFEETVELSLKIKIANFLAKCQNDTGGFGGGPGQMSHLAPTYAAVNALVILNNPKAYEIVNRQKLAEWLNSLRNEDGSFLMHQDGEVDMRGIYCALAIAKLTNVFSNEMFTNTTEWILRCQTYEGGFGSSPGTEAHGGYTFCGLAALMLLGKERLCNADRLLKWISFKQMKLEGGFQGRTNKLVDSCYSFWQGGTFPLIHTVLATDGHAPSVPRENWLFNQIALQEYLLLCCQEQKGGFFDKPGKSRDFYHTSYSLSGLSIAQHFNWGGADNKNQKIFGKPDNVLTETHPIYNIGMEAVRNAANFFNRLEVPTIH